MKCENPCGCQGSKKGLILFCLGLSVLLAGSQYFSENHEAESFDYNDYQIVLKQVDDQGLVDYRALQKDPNALNRFAQSLSQLDPKEFDAWPQNKQLAFWINAYNALTLQAIIDHYPIKPSLLKSLAFPKNSIRQISGVWDKLTFKVMGQDLTLSHIEHEILRKKFARPEIHMSLVCAALSCPPLRNEPFQAATLESQFKDQARRFMSSPITFNLDRTQKGIHLSKIFKWFGQDFVERFLPESGFEGRVPKLRASLHFVSQHLDDADAKFLRNQSYKLDYLPYDWTLNEKPIKTAKNP